MDPPATESPGGARHEQDGGPGGVLHKSDEEEGEVERTEEQSVQRTPGYSS